MRREKWLLGELEKWQAQELVSSETAQAIRQMYTTKASQSTLTMLFSIIGTALIGIGIILISAKNWYNLHIAVRVGLTFLPLVLAQILCFYTLLFRKQSAAWREGSALFMSLSIFAVIALVGQIFHLYGDFGRYIITCGLLGLPIVYILNAASPVLVYYYTVVTWAFVSGGEYEITLVPLAFLLFALALPYVVVVVKNNKNAAKTAFLSWLTLISGFFVVLAITFVLRDGGLPLLLLYFVMLLAFDRTTEPAKPAFYCTGLVGALVMLFILSYTGVWDIHQITSVVRYLDTAVYVLFGLCAAFAAAASYFAYARKRPDNLTRGIVYTSVLLAGLYLVNIFTNTAFIAQTGSAITNLLIFAVSVYLIVRGSKGASLSTINLGMVILFLLIVLRFFDWELDFLFRGIVFVLLGIAFLAVNLYMIKKRKGART